MIKKDELASITRASVPGVRRVSPTKHLFVVSGTRQQRISMDGRAMKY